MVLDVTAKPQGGKKALKAKMDMKQPNAKVRTAGQRALASSPGNRSGSDECKQNSCPGQDGCDGMKQLSTKVVSSSATRARGCEVFA